MNRGNSEDQRPENRNQNARQKAKSQRLKAKDIVYGGLFVVAGKL